MNDQLQLDRRRFFQAGGAATLAFCLGGTAVAAPARAGGTEALDPLRRAGWDALAADGRPLRAGSAVLRLDTLSGAEQAFAVTLRGAPGAAPLEQGVHPLAHPLLADADLFLVPVGPSEGRAYELVVDRSVPAPRRAPAAAGEVAAPAGAAAPAAASADAARPAAAPADAAAPGGRGASASVVAPRVEAAAVAWRAPERLVAELRLAPDRARSTLTLELVQLGRTIAGGSANPLADGSLRAALRQPRGAARPLGPATLVLTAIGVDGGRARTAVGVTLR